MFVMHVPTGHDHLFNSMQMGREATQGPITKQAIVDQMAHTQRCFLNLIPATASGSSAFLLPLIHKLIWCANEPIIES